MRAGLLVLLSIAATGNLSAQTTAPLEDRVVAAKSVKVMTAILGVSCSAELDDAHRKLDPLCAPGKHPKTEGEEDADAESKSGKDNDEEGGKVLWQLAGTDYSAVFVIADDAERIISITGILRSDKQVPFEQIGEVTKAPVRNDRSIVWDVLRPGQPLVRVMARGSGGKAATITIFTVRPKTVTRSRPQKEK